MNKRWEIQYAALSSIVIALAMTTPYAMALRETGFMARVIQFRPDGLVILLLIRASFTFTVLFGGLSLFSGRALLTRARRWALAITGLLTALTAGSGLLVLFGSRIYPRSPFDWPAALIMNGAMLCLALLVLVILLQWRAYRKHADETARLRSATMQARLQALEHQMDPHFLFNALSTLSGLVGDDPERARHFIIELSRNYRHILKARTGMVPLTEEIESLTRYTWLLQERFGPRLHVQVNVPVQDDARIPVMALQPLLENAVKHNRFSDEHPLRFTVTREGSELVCRNDLRPKDADPAYLEEQSGLGLRNLHERCLILLKRGLTIKRDDAHFSVHIPLQA